MMFGYMTCGKNKAEKEDGTKMKAGGGGLCRAFVSHMSKQPGMRDDSGRPCFARIMTAWKAEAAKYQSDLFDSLRAQAEEATCTRRPQFQA